MNTEPAIPTIRHPADFRGSRVLIVGLGRFGGGVAVSRWLAAQGARLTITDLAEAETLSDSLSQVVTLDADLRLGGHGGVDPAKFDLAIINPAVVKRRSGLFGLIEEARTPWTTEMNLFCERCPAKVVGVTGSYGKSTTCAMLATILRAAVTAKAVPHPAVHLGGNIGRSLLGDLDRIRPNDLVILEMSNAQLEDLPRINWTPDLAAITNLWPHHLDRYGSEQDYYIAKLNIARTNKTQSPLIVGDLHPRAEKLLTELVAGVPRRLHRVATPTIPIHLSTPGKHNQSNAAAALAICKRLGVDESFARDALLSFPGLPDRLEYIRTVAGVTFINDSKSTAPTATTKAIQAILQTPEHAKGDVIVIVGGKRQDADLGECARQLAKSCRLIVCMGESGLRFADAIGSETEAEHTQKPAQVECVDALENALALARKDACDGDVVLFSPGAPSFDAYVNYVARGEHFRTLVSAI